MGQLGTEKKSHYTKKVLLKHKSLIPGLKNVKNDPLVKPSDILLPPLHIKLGPKFFFL